MNFRIVQGLVGMVVLGAVVLFTAVPQLKPDWIQIGSGRGPRGALPFRPARFDMNSPESRLALAAELILDQDWNGATRELDEVIRQQPKNAEAYLLRSVAWQRMELWDKALSDLDEVLKLSPDDDDAYYTRAEIKADQGDVKAALADLDTVLRLAPNSPDALCFRGKLREDRGEYAAALADYRQAVKLEDEDPLFLNNLAWLLATAPDAKLRNGAEAQKLAMKAVELDSEDWDLLDTLAAACAENRNWPGAIRCQTDALKLVPPEDKAEVQERLELYRAKQPYRLPIR